MSIFSNDNASGIYWKSTSKSIPSDTHEDTTVEKESPEVMTADQVKTSEAMTANQEELDADSAVECDENMAPADEHTVAFDAVSMPLVKVAGISLN